MDGAGRIINKNNGLKIVELTPFNNQMPSSSSKILMSNNKNRKYYQIVEQGGKQINLMNVAVVEWDQERQTYKQITDAPELHALDANPDEEVTCMVPADQITNAGDTSSQYVMMNEDGGPVVFVQSTMESAQKPGSDTEEQDAAVDEVELLEQSQARDKIKALLIEEQSTKRGRKRKYPLPAPSDLNRMSDVRLYLYSCNMCQYRCNAIKDLSEHKEKTHGRMRRKRPATISSNKFGNKLKITYHQCPKCPFKGVTNYEFTCHYKSKHGEEDDSSND